MIAQYKITATSKTETGASLPNPFYLVISAASLEDQIMLKVHTYQGQEEQSELGNEEHIPNGFLIHSYDPATDNAKSINTLLTENFEANLTTWFGSGNWIKL